MGISIGDIFKPGQKCEASGIYTVVHDTGHAINHEVTVVFGEPFPPCNHCGAHPRFKATRIAQHIKYHDSFK